MASIRNWNAPQYLKFANERNRPVLELLAQVPLVSAGKIVDLGCGPGNSTQILASKFTNSDISAIDSSESMLEDARRALPHVNFELADLNTFVPTGQVDLFFSNAVFQWIPGDRRIPVIRRLLAHQSSGACFAMSVPDVFYGVNHTAMQEIARHSQWEGTLDFHSPLHDPMPSPREYYDAFYGSLCSEVNTWSTTYDHHVADHEAIVDWFRATGLRLYLQQLDGRRQEEFLDMYRQRVREAYPPLDDGSVLMSYRRLFVVLKKL